ncbi:MAG: transaldolase family protein [Anaerolineales bacterium]
MNELHEKYPALNLQIHRLSSNLGYPVANNIGARLAHIMSPYKTQELIWASPRELLNIFHADEIGCHVITVTHDILKKLSLVGKGLDEYSLDTVKMFYEDAQKAGYQL